MCFTSRFYPSLEYSNNSEVSILNYIPNDEEISFYFPWTDSGFTTQIATLRFYDQKSREFSSKITGIALL